MDALAQPRGISGERSLCVTELVHVGVHNALMFSYFYYYSDPKDFRGDPSAPPPNPERYLGIDRALQSPLRDWLLRQKETHTPPPHSDTDTDAHTNTCIHARTKTSIPEPRWSTRCHDTRSPPGIGLDTYTPS